MTVSKRLRYEILNRDGFACRYCGAKAPDATLVVDHVTPKALGGTDEPTNLVAACRDCNTGKSSVSPDANTVADVERDDLEWSRRIRQALDEMAEDRARTRVLVNTFHDWWCRPNCGFNDKDLPWDWADSVKQFLAAGLDLYTITEMAETAQRNLKVHRSDVWRYFCGCCWGAIRQAHERARELP